MIDTKELDSILSQSSHSPGLSLRLALITAGYSESDKGWVKLQYLVGLRAVNHERIVEIQGYFRDKHGVDVRRKVDILTVQPGTFKERYAADIRRDIENAERALQRDILGPSTT